MPGQERIQKSGSERTDTSASGVAPTADAEKIEQLKNDLDSLLDEIDDVLEENAEDFVRNYVQKGGE